MGAWWLWTGLSTSRSSSLPQGAAVRPALALTRIWRRKVSTAGAKLLRGHWTRLWQDGSGYVLPMLLRMRPPSRAWLLHGLSPTCLPAHAESTGEGDDAADVAGGRNEADDEADGGGEVPGASPDAGDEHAMVKGVLSSMLAAHGEEADEESSEGGAEGGGAEARSQPASTSAPSAPAASKQHLQATACTVFVRGLPLDVTQIQLQTKMEAYGRVKACRYGAAELRCSRGAGLPSAQPGASCYGLRCARCTHWPPYDTQAGDGQGVVQAQGHCLRGVQAARGGQEGSRRVRAGQVCAALASFLLTALHLLLCARAPQH